MTVNTITSMMAVLKGNGEKNKWERKRERERESVCISCLWRFACLLSPINANKRHIHSYERYTCKTSVYLTVHIWTCPCVSMRRLGEITNKRMDSSCVPSTSCYADRSLNVRAGVVRRFLIGAHSVHSTTHPWRKAPTDFPNLLFVGPFMIVA